MTAKAGLKTLNHREDWQTARVKFLFKRETRPVLETDEVITAFRDGTVTLRKNRREDGFTFAEQEIGYQGVEPGDLVIHAMDGFAGAIGVSDSRGKGSPVLTVATPITHLDVRFWGYYLRNLAITGFIQSLAKGIRERSTDFRWKDVSNLLVNFPDLSTQREIADFLDRETARIDLLIEKKQKLVALLGEKRSTTITEAVTGAGNHGSAEGGGGMRPDWLENMPPSWSSVPFGSIFTQSKRKNSRLQRDFVLSVMKDRGVIPYTEKGNVGNKVSDDLSGYKLVDKGDFILNSMNLYMGSVGVSEYDGVTSTAYIVCKPSEDVYAGYYNYLIQFKGFQEYVGLLGKGIMEIREAVRWTALKSVFVPLPDLSTQREIADFLDRETARIVAVRDKTNASITHLKEYRSALITAAVTGQIDVTTYAKSDATDRRLDAIQEEMGA